MREEKDYSGILSAAILVGLTGLLVWFFLSHGKDPGPLEPPSVEQQATDVTDADCGAVVERCSLQVDFKSPDCKKAAAKAEIQRRLGDPLSTDECRKAELKLADKCPPGCTLDYSSLLSIPGNIRFEFFSTPDEAKECLASGERDVTMQAYCIKAE